MPDLLESERMFGYARPGVGPAMQRSFDDLGTALVDTEFCVFDLETTGGSPEACRITEIGAVKVRGGEVVGEFATLVNPGVPIPPTITYLTGITDAMVCAAPLIEDVLPTFVEFIGDAVFVAHNASFDTRFLAANLARFGYPAAANPVVCTVRLARRLVRDEVPNLRLATLAHALRARTTPCHRALDDARATVDVFHGLLERAGRWGVSHLDDLLWFQSARGHPSYNKVRLTETLPRARGVYLFRGARDRVLYVGKATDLRSRVRSYFGGDDRRHIDGLLREVESIEHILCPTDLEASVVEARLIRAHSPPYNRAQRGRSARWFLRLSSEQFPRLVSSRTDEGLGPMPSAVTAAVREALEEAADIRTCTARIGPRTRFASCVRGQIGRCPAPCEGRIDPAAYASIAGGVARALDGDPSDVLETLAGRIGRLSDEDRFEEAASSRDRLAALVDAIRSARAARTLRPARFTIAVGAHNATIDEGFLSIRDPASDGHPDEPRLIAAWLWRNRARIRIVESSGELAMPVAGGKPLAEWAERLRRLHLVGREPQDALPRPR
ncbi:MAG: DEDD exonuclease domain-containing protein [Actinomycetota bacterium]